MCDFLKKNLAHRPTSRSFWKHKSLPTSPLYFLIGSISIAENDAFHVTVKLVNMPFNKDHILIKNLYLLKGYSA